MCLTVYCPKWQLSCIWAGGRESVKILSSALEAVIGAYFLDSGLESTWQLIERLLPEFR